MNVLIPRALQSYTGAADVEATGKSLAELLGELDSRHPGIRFRVVDEQDRFRRHLRCFINGTQVQDLGRGLSAEDEVIIIQVLSGG
jgi:molybdopterin converting factor small subunit